MLQAQRELQALPGQQRGGQHPCLGMNGQGVGVAGHAAGQHHELPGALAFGETAGAPGRRVAMPIGQDPDLEDAAGDVFAVVFGVLNASAGAHHLHVAGHGAALVAEIVAVADGAAAHVGDDFHVAVRMGREAAAGGDLVIVPDPQSTPVHALRVVVLGEREVMASIQPAVLGVAEAIEWA